MGYKMPIVCKEVYLPVDTDGAKLTFEQYKEKTGIDLHDVFDFVFNNGYIEVSVKGMQKVYLAYVGKYLLGAPVNIIDKIDMADTYEYESSDASTSLVVTSGLEFFGLRFSIDKQVVDPTINDIKITAFES